MTKYIIAILIFVILLVACLLYIGGDAVLVIRSTAGRYPFNFGEIEVKWQFFIVMLVLGLIGILILWSFAGWLMSLPGRFKSGVGLRRRHKALDAMEEALIAGAEGDVTRARKKSEQARNLIESQALGRMVSAQAAEACGDSEEAIAQYSALLDNEKTAATAQRGLAQQLLTRGDFAGAIQHAGSAYEDNKSARWAFDILFQAQISDHRWDEAIKTLELAESRKHIDKTQARRRMAVLKTAEANSLKTKGDTQSATDMAVQAANLVSDFAPAVALAANLLSQSGDIKKATSLIEKAWSKGPHPALVLAMRDTVKAEPQKIKNKRMAALMRANPDHRESQILKIEEALFEGDGVKAWSALTPLIDQEDGPSARLCMLAAEAETMLKNPQDAAIWMERAAIAPVEADWSDLDPEGESFDYTDQDWRRLVFSFGDKGELIHPRFEVGAARRSHSLSKRASQEANTASAPETNLAERLNNLLDEGDQKLD